MNPTQVKYLLNSHNITLCSNYWGKSEDNCTEFVVDLDITDPNVRDCWREHRQCGQRP